MTRSWCDLRKREVFTFCCMLGLKRRHRPRWRHLLWYGSQQRVLRSAAKVLIAGPMLSRLDNRTRIFHFRLWRHIYSSRERERERERGEWDKGYVYIYSIGVYLCHINTALPVNQGRASKAIGPPTSITTITVLFAPTQRKKNSQSATSAATVISCKSEKHAEHEPRPFSWP